MLEYQLSFKLAKYKSQPGFVFLYRPKEKEKVVIETLIEDCTRKCSTLFNTPVKFIKYKKVLLKNSELGIEQ